jgi:two-component system, OmpR family, sensor kinase
MTRVHSLVSRLSLIVSLWVGGLWIVCSMGVAWYVHKEITEGFDAVLVESAHRLLDLVVHEVDDFGKPASPEVASSDIAHDVAHPAKTNYDRQGVKVENDYLIYQVMDSAGALILRSANAPETILVKTLLPGFAEGEIWRSFVMRHPVQNLWIVVGDSMDHRRQAQQETMLWLLLPLLGLLPLLILVVRKLIYSALAPLQRIASEIAVRSGGDLSPIAVDNLPMELQTISDSANHLLLRLDDALKTERALAANAAHELRTPLAAARLSLSTAQVHPMSEQAKLAIDQVALSLNTLGKRAEKLLQMSRAEAAAALSHESIDLGALASAVAQEFWQHSAASKHLTLQLPEDSQVTTRGDFDSLAIALRNLIENSLKYAPSADITVVVSNPATIIVRDAGDGVLTADLEKLRQRHVRLNPNQVGYGLGLSIVRTIIEKQGGRLELRSPPPGYVKGFEAVLKLGPH